MTGLESTQVQSSTANRSRNLLILAAVLIVIFVCCVWVFNYFSVNRPLHQVLTSDPRNKVINAHAHFEHWIDPSTLVFDLIDVSGNATRIDVFRALLQYSQAMKDRHFTKVILAARG